MLGVYIHIPFCKKICNYCDFCKMNYNEKYIKNYLNNLKKEIHTRYKGEKIDTLYIGGGTPTSLTLEELEYLLEITNIFNKEDDIEFTIESNIEDMDINKINLLKSYGVNRISFGVESFNKESLNILGRTHTKEEIFDTIDLTKKYFSNINIDLIYGVTDNIDTLKEDIHNFLLLDIPHISCYSLILEKNTKLYNDKFTPISEDIDYEMYNCIKEELKKKGYNHYEISNYAKKGYESIHNKIITPLEKYPSFVFHDLHNSRISIEKSNEFDRMAGPKLNLSVDLNSDLDSIPKIIQNYLLEYYRLSGSNLKEDSKLDSINNLNRTIEFLESLYNEESKIDRRDELFSLSLMLFFYDYIFEDYVNEKHIFESVKDMKDFYGKRISLKSQEERKELEDSYRLFSLEKNIHHASSNKKKIKIDDFFSYLENFLKEHECSKLSKKTDNGIDLILDDGKFTKSKNLTKDAFAKLKKRTLASKATILQRAIDS